MIQLIDTFARCREVSVYISSPKGSELIQQVYAESHKSTFLQHYLPHGSIEQILNNLYCNGSYPTVSTMIDQLTK